MGKWFGMQELWRIQRTKNRPSEIIITEGLNPLVALKGRKRTSGRNEIIAYLFRQYCALAHRAAYTLYIRRACLKLECLMTIDLVQVISFLEVSIVFSAVLMVITLSACDRQSQ